MLHRLTVGVVGLFLAYVLVAGLRRHRRLAALTLLALAVQVALGALVAVTSEVAFLQGAHIVVGSALWAGVVALAVLALRPAPAAVRDDARVTALEGRPA